MGVTRCAASQKMKTDQLPKPPRSAQESLGGVRVDARYRAEQELASLLRYGHFSLGQISQKLGIPMVQLLQMRQGLFFDAPTLWIFNTAKAIRDLVRNKPT